MPSVRGFPSWGYHLPVFQRLPDRRPRHRRQRVRPDRAAFVHAGWRRAGREGAGLGQGTQRQGRGGDRRHARVQDALEAQIRAILDSDLKIPGVEKIGGYYYNFWKDKQHERGVWRRTTLDEYRKPEPKWETVLDLDALNKAENAKWVWHGADCLKPKYERCLIALSPGGSDADVTREFNDHQQFVPDELFHGSQGRAGWIDEDTVYVFTDFGPGTGSHLGLSNIDQEGQARHPLSAAKAVYEGKPGDMYIAAMRDHARLAA